MEDHSNETISKELKNLQFKALVYKNVENERKSLKNDFRNKGYLLFTNAINALLLLDVLFGYNNYTYVRFSKQMKINFNELLLLMKTLQFHKNTNYSVLLYFVKLLAFFCLLVLSLLIPILIAIVCLKMLVTRLLSFIFDDLLFWKLLLSYT